MLAKEYSKKLIFLTQIFQMPIYQIQSWSMQLW